MYDGIQERIADYERGLLRKLAKVEQKQCRGAGTTTAKQSGQSQGIRRRGQEAMREAFYRMSGVDITQIDATGAETVEVVLTEYGPDLSRFPTEK
jgi:hypothetical protein